MQLEKREIERSLPKKGFVRDERPHHTYFLHLNPGIETGPFTYTSHGKAMTYGPNLISRMRQQLQLKTNQQVVDLVKCPLDSNGYNQVLIEKGVFTEEEISRKAAAKKKRS